MSEKETIHRTLTLDQAVVEQRTILMKRESERVQRDRDDVAADNVRLQEKVTELVKEAKKLENQLSEKEGQLKNQKALVEKAEKQSSDLKQSLSNFQAQKTKFQGEIDQKEFEKKIIFAVAVFAFLAQIFMSQLW